jgi:hypothetical protein
VVTVNGVVVPVQSASYQNGQVVLGLEESTLQVGDEVVVSWNELRDTRGNRLNGNSDALRVR